MLTAAHKAIIDQVARQVAQEVSAPPQSAPVTNSNAAPLPLPIITPAR